MNSSDCDFDNMELRALSAEAKVEQFKDLLYDLVTEMEDEDTEGRYFFGYVVERLRDILNE